MSQTGTLVPDEEPLTARELEEQRELFSEIDGESLRDVRDILRQFPRLLNREFDADGDGLEESPLQRAVNTQNINLIRLLVDDLDADVTPRILQYQIEILENARPDEDAAATAIFRLLEGTEEGEDDEGEDEEGEYEEGEYEEEEGEPLTMAELVARKKLHEAIEANDIVTAKAVLAQYPKLINIRYNDETPLSRAISFGNLALVKHLVENGVDVDENDLDHIEFDVEEAVSNGMTESEIENGMDIAAVIRARLAQQSAARGTPAPLSMAELAARKKLHEAIESRDNVTAKAILTQYPQLADMRAFNNRTPILNAIYSRNLEIVKYLLEKGVIPTQLDLSDAISLAERPGQSTPEAERQIARDILLLIQAHVAPAIAPRAIDFGDESALPTIEVTEIEYKELPDVFDMTLNKDIPIFDALAKRRLIFTVDDSYYGITLQSIESSLKDKTSTFYECKKELKGAPYTKDVHIDTPYFRLTLNGNFTVTEKDLQSALASECSIFELVPNEKKLAFVSSYASVQVSPGRNGLGEDVNIVSSDHCQKGSDQFTYDMKAVTMVKYRSAEQKEVDRVQAEKKAVEDAAVAERMKQEAIVRKKAQEEQAARVAARGSGRRRTGGKKRKTYRKGNKSNKRKTYRK